MLEMDAGASNILIRMSEEVHGNYLVEQTLTLRLTYQHYQNLFSVVFMLSYHWHKVTCTHWCIFIAGPFSSPAWKDYPGAIFVHY